MMGGGNDTTRSPKAAGGILDEPTRRIAERLLNMPPKQHKDMKLGKAKAETKENKPQLRKRKLERPSR
jgi:hypothetical protein